MDAFQIVEALSASFFALLGIWAAVDRRHWFVRFAVVSTALLAALLVPAYEVVIEFGLQVAIIMAGVWLARGRSHWRPRLSLETALLAMVVVAVVAAVVAGVPTLHPAIWAFVITVGICTGYAGLLALWVVCGRAKLPVRVVVGLLGLALFVGLFHFGHAIQRALWQSSGGFNWQAFNMFYAELTAWWLAEKLPTIALASVLLITVLSLARASGWFTGSSSQPARPSRRAVAARIGLAALMLAVVAPLGYLLYRLATPPSRELLADLPSPNGFDDFVAAGEATPASVRRLWQRPAASRATGLDQHERELAKVAELVSRGLRKPCRTPLRTIDADGVNPTEGHAISMASAGLAARVISAVDRGAPDDICQSSLLLLQFVEHGSRGSVAMQWYAQNYAGAAFRSLRDVVGRLDEQQCLAMADVLLQLDREREPHAAKEARQLIADKNISWAVHLNILLKGWSGESTYEAFRKHHKQSSNQLRLLASGMAAQAYYLQHDKIPISLRALVPDFLPYVPLDAHTGAPLRFRRYGSKYVIYSVGRDGIDQTATSNPSTPNRSDDSKIDGPHNREGEAPAEPL